MYKPNIIITLIAAVLATGCGTVQSTYQDPSKLSGVSDSQAEGALYFLPKRQVTVTATQTPVTAQSIAAAQTELTSRTAAVTAAQLRVTAAQNTSNTEQGTLLSLTTGEGVTSEEIERQNQVVRRALAALATQQRALVAANTERDQAAATLAQSRSALSLNMPNYNITLSLEEPEPDLEYTYRANFSHNWMRDDDFDLAITNRGLLSSTNIIADDQTDEIIVELAGAVAAVATGLPPLSSPAGGADRQSILDDTDKEDEVSPIETPKIPTCSFATNVSYRYQTTFDPTDLEALGTVNSELQKCFPYELDFKDPSYSGVGDPPSRSAITGKSTGSRNKLDYKPIQGLVYRAALPYVLSVKQCTTEFALLSPSGERGFVTCNVQSHLDDVLVSKRIQIGRRYYGLINALTADISAANAEVQTGLISWDNNIKTLSDSMQAWAKNENATSVQAQLSEIRLLEFPNAAAPRVLAQRLLNIAENIENDLQTKPNPYREAVPAQSNLVMLTNNGPLSVIPLKSSAFVRSVHDVTFENGILTQWDREAPSEMAEVVRLPVEIMRQIVSVPAELFQLRVNLTENQNGLLASQNAQIQSQLQTRLLQDCILDVQAGQREVSECLSAMSAP